MGMGMADTTARCGTPARPSPVVLRPRKTRSKTGCLCCRLRRKKCDEVKPICSSCSKLDLICSWLSHDEFAWRKRMGLSTVTTTTTNDADTADVIERDWGNLAVSVSPSSGGSSNCGSSPDKAMLDAISHCFYAGDSILSAFSIANSAPPMVRTGVPKAVPLSDPPTQQLLHLYTEQTCRRLLCYPAGLVNPYVADVLPVAFSDPLVLHAVLALGGFPCRHADLASSLETARLEHYGKVLNGMKHAVTQWTPESGTAETRRLFLVIVLMLQWEVIRGNPQGFLFHHIRAGRHFAKAVFDDDALRDDRLVGILLESYAFVDLGATMRVPPPSEDVEAILRSPVLELKNLRHYRSFGAIFGCAAGLYSLVPRIAKLAIKRHNEIAQGEGDQTDCENEFYLLLGLITSWRGNEDGETSSRLYEELGYPAANAAVGELARQAMLLFVYVAYCFETAELRRLSQPIVDRAIELTKDIQYTPWENAAFWSIFMIASCAVSAEQREQVLGFIRPVMLIVSRGVRLLHSVWNSPDDLFGPYGLARVIEADGTSWCCG